MRVETPRAIILDEYTPLPEGRELILSRNLASIQPKVIDLLFV
jgi:hypothetical protein